MGKNRRIYLVTLLIFLAYSAWMIGPYLRSVIVRDASVTTWLNTSVAPISGKIISQLPEVGSQIGPDQTVAVIRNDLLFQEKLAVEGVSDRVTFAKVQLDAARRVRVELEAFEQSRIAARDRSAEIFHQQLEADVRGLQARIAANADRIDVLQRIVDRQQSLASRGSGSAASLDEELLRLNQAKLQQTELQAALDFAALRDKATEDGVFIGPDGGTPDWLRFAELELWLELNRVRQAVQVAEIKKSEAEKDLAVQIETLGKLQQATATAPEGSTVFSILAAPSATVVSGDRIIEWIDCKVLLIDVPVSDAALPLMTSGMAARVIMEGRTETLTANVVLTRGSAATLGRADLAAISKGRSEGTAQALLSIDLSDLGLQECPVGQAAYVDFPDIGLIDILRARLRL